MRGGMATARSLCGACCGMSGVRFIRPFRWQRRVLITRMGEKSCRAIVYERAERFCERCCRGGPVLTVHHRRKRSQGGLWTPGNCVLVCGSGTTGCHGWIEHNPVFARAEGFHVQPWVNPLEVSVFWRMSQWVFLDDDGNLIDDVSTG
jgi:hypothetical protein